MSTPTPLLLLLGPLILSDEGPALKTSFSLIYCPECRVSEYSYTGGLGFNILIWRGPSSVHKTIEGFKHYLSTLLDEVLGNRRMLRFGGPVCVE